MAALGSYILFYIKNSLSRTRFPDKIFVTYITLFLSG